MDNAAAVVVCAFEDAHVCFAMLFCQCYYSYCWLVVGALSIVGGCFVVVEVVEIVGLNVELLTGRRGVFILKGGYWTKEQKTMRFAETNNASSIKSEM